MTRVAGWPRLLNEYIASLTTRAQAEPFRYGSFDCTHMAADWVLKCTGVDHLAEYRGTYATKEQAVELLERLGGLSAELERKLGQPVHPSQGHRGDIALRLADGSCGILFTSGGRMRGLFLGEHGGLVVHRLSDIDLAYRV